MSSPPTTNTSVKAAHLSTSKPEIRQKLSSFSPIATLNLFRKKLPAPQLSSPVEPYEVAPGIWSTDATATVFGYLDTNNKRARLKVQRTGPEIQALRQKTKRKPVPIRDPLGVCDQASFGESTEQYDTDEMRDESEAPTSLRQQWKDGKGVRGESKWFGANRVKMRTVSRDDQLIERGANPRTGLVSPFVVSDSSEECLGGDYIIVDKIGSTGLSSGRRTRSEKWKQDSLGWSLVESPLLSPIAQSMSDKMSRTVSTKELEDRLLVEMPGVDNPDPDKMTCEQIKKYQEGIARAYKRGGSIAMLDPDTLPSPRQWTPEGPSTPPTKLHKIQRKELRGGVVSKSNSGDTVIINVNNRASSLPTPRKDIVERQRVRIITPSNTPKGSSFESCASISNAWGKPDPFLGPGSQTTCSQTASATQSQSYPNNGQAHQSRQNESESSPSSTVPNPPAAPQTLSQYLPRLQLLHPSHFANLETSSHRHPTQLRLRRQRRQRPAVEDACTTTFTTASIIGPRWERRPKIHRQDGNDVLPRVNHLYRTYEKPLDGHLQAGTPKDKQIYPRNLPVDTLHTPGLVIGRNQATESTEKTDPVRDLARANYQRKTQMPAECLRQPPSENRRRNLTFPMNMAQGLSLGSANAAQNHIQRNQSGNGCTPTYGHLGNLSTPIPGERHQYNSDDKDQAIQPAELTFGGDSRAWFAGQWAEVKKEGERPHLSALMQEETLVRRQSALRKAAEMKLWLYSMEASVGSLAKLGPIQQLLHRIICHVMRTLHHAWFGLSTLRMANATTWDHFRAMKDLALAALFLLVLLISVMVLRGVLVFLSKVLYCVWHPIQTILRIIGWCIVG